MTRISKQIQFDERKYLFLFEKQSFIEEEEVM